MTKTSHPQTSHRDGECVANVPDIQPVLAADEKIVSASASARAWEAAPPDVPPKSIPAWMRWGYCTIALFLAGIFGVYLFSQAINALALAGTLPVWAQYLLLIPLGFCCLVVLGSVVGLARAWLRLRTMSQVDITALEELRQRAKTRKDGLERYQAARTTLENYLREYPLGEHSPLQGIGIPEDEIGALRRDREYLLGKTTDSQSWLADFSSLYQAKIDRAAEKRVASWSLKAAGCVMASPLPFLDAVLILGISFRMIRDLCVLYNVRTGKTGSVVLLSRSIRNAFIAGVAEDASTMAGEILGDEAASMFGETAVGAVGSSFARIIAPKLGEGAINGLFMRRLGRAAMRLLQPIRP